MTAAREALARAVRWATGRTGRLCLVCGRGGEWGHAEGCWLPEALAALGEGERKGEG